MSQNWFLVAGFRNMISFIFRFFFLPTNSGVNQDQGVNRFQDDNGNSVRSNNDDSIGSDVDPEYVADSTHNSDDSCGSDVPELVPRGGFQEHDNGNSVTSNTDDSIGSNVPELVPRGGVSILVFEHDDWVDSSPDDYIPDLIIRTTSTDSSTGDDSNHSQVCLGETIQLAPLVFECNKIASRDSGYSRKYNLRRYFDIVGIPYSEDGTDTSSYSSSISDSIPELLDSDGEVHMAEDESVRSIQIRKRYTCPPIDPVIMDVLRFQGKLAEDIGASHYSEDSGKDGTDTSSYSSSTSGSIPELIGPNGEVVVAEDESVQPVPPMIDHAEDDQIRKRYTCPPIDQVIMDILRLEGKLADDIGASHYVKRYLEKPGIDNTVSVDALLELALLRVNFGSP